MKKPTTLALMFLSLLGGVSPAVEALPDMVPIADVAKNYVHGWRLDQTTLAGRVLLRLSTGVGNSGQGPIEIWGGTVSGATQEVYQRLYNTDGTTRDRLAGSFVYHPQHGHVHFEGFAIYNLRRIEANNGIGSIIAAGQKTSFCLVNIDNYWPTLTASALVRNGRGGSSCGTIQGISVGYADIYGSQLADQWIDVTGVPSGTYWLEVIADPDNRILEMDETNNTVRIQVTYNNPLNPVANRAPVLATPGDQNTVRGDLVNLSLTASDPDGNPLTFRALGLPTGLSINAATGAITGTVAANAAASYDTTIIASDGTLDTSVTLRWTTEAALNGTGLRAEYFQGTAFNTYKLTRLDAGINFLWSMGSPDATITPDAFSVRWRGKVVPRFSETYSFHVTADDSVRLRLNGQLVIDRWTTGLGAEATGTIALVAGQEADLVLEYAETNGPANISLAWSSARQTKGTVPASRLFPAPENRAPTVFRPENQVVRVSENANLATNATDADNDVLTYSAVGLPPGITINASTGFMTGTYTTAGTFATTLSVTDGRLTGTNQFTWTVNASGAGQGLRAEYYNGRTFDRPALIRTDANIDNAWGTAAPASTVDADNFSVRWTGEILPLYSEDYTFVIEADNGVRLHIADNLLVQDWEPSTGDDGGWHSATIRLTAGVRAPFRLDYYDAWGGAAVKVYWFSASQPWEIIPSSRFFPAADGGTRDLNPPNATLATTASGILRGAFPVTLRFNEPITGLTMGDLILSNGTISNLTGASTAWSFTVTPGTANAATLQLPGQAVLDVGGNGNTASNILNFLYGRNTAPVVTMPAQTAVRGSAHSAQAIGTDADGDTITWSATQLPLGLAIHPTTGLISGTINLEALATATSTVTATDALGATTSLAVPWTIAGSSPGLRAEYFNGRNFNTPILTRIDPTIDFTWPAAPAPGVDPDNFSVRWTGTINPAWTEDYTFVVAVDNGVRLRVNGALLIDKFGDDVNGWFNATARLTAGVPAHLSIEYKEEYGGAGITVYWYSARQNWEPLTTSRLQPGSGGSVPQPSVDTSAFAAAAAQIRQSLHIANSTSSPRVTYILPAQRLSGAAYILETSTDLRSWSASSAPLSAVLLNNGDTRYTATIPANAPRAFFRVAVGIP
jgi:hypothetical protein